MVCMAVKMHWELRIWAEIVQTAWAPQELEGFSPSPPSLCNTGVLCVAGSIKQAKASLVGESE